MKKTPYVLLTRREHFNAAHRLYREEWSDERNMDVFGKCSNPNWHGHNYVLYVTVRGTVDPLTGFVVNLKTLSDAINFHVIEKIDHRNVNLEVGFMKGKIASTENMAVAIWEVLEPVVLTLGCSLFSVKIEETENNFFEYKGEFNI